MVENSEYPVKESWQQKSHSTKQKSMELSRDIVEKYRQVTELLKHSHSRKTYRISHLLRGISS